MAQEIRAPIEAPNLGEFLGKEGFDHEGYRATESLYLERLASRFRESNPGDTVGEVLRWQRADSYATYMVVSEKPLTITHLDLGDGWTIEPALIRGLNLSDVREMVRQNRALAAFFATR